MRAPTRGVSLRLLFFTHCTVRWRTIYREACCACNGGGDCEWGPLEELLFTVPYDIFHSALWACLAGWAGWGQERKKKRNYDNYYKLLTHPPPVSLSLSTPFCCRYGTLQLASAHKMHVWPTGNHKTEARNKSCFVLLRIILGKFSNRWKGGICLSPLAENLMHKIVSSIYLFSLFIFVFCGRFSGKAK